LERDRSSIHAGLLSPHEADTISAIQPVDLSNKSAIVLVFTDTGSSLWYPDYSVFIFMVLDACPDVQRIEHSSAMGAESRLIYLYRLFYKKSA
jgi:hypothetical protein